MSPHQTDALARTLDGEARSEGAIGMSAVASVVLNRVKKKSWWGRTIKGVCKFPWQFSCWNKTKDNARNLKHLTNVTTADPTFAKCVAVAEIAVAGLLKDSTNGATHYMTKARRKRGWPRSWGKPRTPCAEIGDHLFYKGIK